MNSLINKTDLAQRLGVTPRTISNWIAAGVLPKRDGRIWRRIEVPKAHR